MSVSRLGRVALDDQIRFQLAIGEVLRRARLKRGMTLRDVETRSEGSFRSSAVGGYERGERSISLYRFGQMARLYGVAAEELLAQALGSMSQARQKIVIDLSRISVLDRDQSRVLAAFAHGVQAKRSDYLTKVISLRAGDIEELAVMSGTTPAELLKRLRPVLK